MDGRIDIDADLARARAQFERHGYRGVTPIDAGAFRGFHAQPEYGGPATFFSRGDDFVAVAGTLTYDGMMGERALSALLAAFSFPFDDWSRLQGQFVLLVRKNGETFLLTDFFAAFHLYRDEADSLFSTSFLAAAGALERIEFDPQGVYEFAFNVFPTGSDSVLKQLKRLSPYVQLKLEPDVERNEVEKPLPPAPLELPLQDRLRQNADRLRQAIAPFVESYGDDIQCPLSGGLDSRLVLALLREAGVTPHVYVYGSHRDADVSVAQAIADREGFPLEVFDKGGAATITPDDFAETVERQFHETDALPTDGSLFDNGGNAIARRNRQAGGQLPISGGCGEVFRNFFFLADRPLSAREVVGAFFARFTTADVGPAFNSKRFLSNLENKALAALRETDPERPLPRNLIEQLYPRMRCRAFFGREISLVGSHGPYAMPFFDQRVVETALEIPLRLKNAGIFEGALLRSIDPRLASYMSGYGYAFDRAPALSQQLAEFGTRIRPTWMRRRSYALRRRLGPMEDEHGGLLSNGYLGRVIDLHFPHMSRFFRVQNVRDSGIYRRIAGLEYLAQKLEDKLN
ncbi:hypothetical protein B5C34_05455 [Pacificimonas flava]|uniref:Asparagine synthetase domain-containing protein n=1 Tax=Pacificimonas flava TaxID=1234595 RepID=A0A219B590_9SPHN|nr:hypothetical protein B5C34_05455 [Pacificimonas flava]